MQTITRNEIINKLYKCNEYNSLKSNKERIDYIFTNIINYDQIKSLLISEITNSRQKNGKNMVLAKNYKMIADFYLQQVSLGSIDNKSENLNQSLKYYSRAILYIPILEDIQMAARLYARKCQVHLHLNELQAALYSIRTAIDLCDAFMENSVPASIKIQYSILEINCLKLLSRFNDAINSINDLINRLNDNPDLFKSNQQQQTISIEELIKMKDNIMSMNDKHQQQQQQPQQDDDYFSYWIDERCSIQQSPVVGRHFIANKRINEKTRILQEKPYSIVIEMDYLHKKCSNCYKELKYKLYPCLYCTEMIFCDLNCFKQSYNLYHLFECGIMSTLKSLTSASVHVFRMISRITPIVAYKTERNNSELNDYCIDDYLRENNQRTVPEINKTLDEKCRAYKMSSILWDHNSKHSEWANVYHIVIGIETSILLDIIHNMQLNYDKKFMLDFIDMVIVDIRRIIFNVFGWHEYNADWSLRGHIANCQCLVGSLINHSCVPNTNWEFKNGQIIFTTNKTIEKGEEITITYGPNKEMSYQKRQERLNHYFFACHCKVCMDDARRGYALRCIYCCNDDQNDENGPVPFMMPLDNEPVLTGQCLRCFQKYPDFEAKVEEFKQCQNNLRQIERLMPLQPDLMMLTKAKEILKKLANLSIVPNPIVTTALSSFTNIVKNFPKHLLDVDEKLILCLFVDAILPHTINIDDNNNGQLFTIIYYWFETILEFIIIMQQQHQQQQRLPDNNVEYKAWDVLNNLKQRLYLILNGWKQTSSRHHHHHHHQQQLTTTKDITNSGAANINSTIIDIIIKNLQEQFENVINNCCC